MSIKTTHKILGITYSQCKEWLLHKHYAHRIPSITHSFGLYDGDNILQGICTFGSPPSPSLCIGIAGVEYKDRILELNRLVITDNHNKNLLSFFVSKCLSSLPTNTIVVSYADTSQGHTGYIYQACNFFYTGLSAYRTEWQLKGENKHSKSIVEKYTLQERRQDERFITTPRAQKHRYLFFVGNKRDKKLFMCALKYPILPYPKGDNKRYDASYRPNTQGLLI